uniref:G_PROTEIN_RECEP_F1_2 domain-containing protein n=1 Tax=Steinernema glaseri TaxID=37863 RepID=A0A1I7XZV9_9BILA
MVYSRGVESVSSELLTMAAIDEHIAISCFRLFVWTTASFGNCLILYVILGRRSLRKRAVNLLFAQLAIGDLITGTVSGVRGLSVILFNALDFHDYTKRLCLFLGIPGLMGIHMSQSTMLAIALDRLLCIKFPVQYRHMETMKFAFFRFVLCFGFAATMTGVAFEGIGARGDDRITVCSTGRSLPVWYAEQYWNFLACFFTLFIY